jgi:Sec-independent protein translocase protein TatA
MIEGPIAWSLLSAVFTGGIAVGGFKVAMNGTKDRIEKLEEQEQDTQEHRVEVAERLASLETKIDIILEKV